MPDFWMSRENVQERTRDKWSIGIKDVTSVTNERTVISAVLPECAAVHTLPVLLLDANAAEPAVTASLVVSNLNSFIFDFFSRQKVQTNHLSEYILDELPVLGPSKILETSFGSRSAKLIIQDHVLRLTYTAHDLAPFARDMGYINKDGSAKPPII